MCSKSIKSSNVFGHWFMVRWVPENPDDHEPFSLSPVINLRGSIKTINYRSRFLPSLKTTSTPTAKSVLRPSGTGVTTMSRGWPRRWFVRPTTRSNFFRPCTRSPVVEPTTSIRSWSSFLKIWVSLLLQGKLRWQFFQMPEWIIKVQT